MAKVISSNDLRGTFGDFTFVKSLKYGNHIRAKRGTHKKAKLNKSFKLQIKKLPGANLHAKIFKDAIDPFRAHFKDWTMWSRLVKLFMEHFDVHGKFDFTRMEPFEIHHLHTFNSLIKTDPEISIDKKKSVINVSLPHDIPRFKKSAPIDGYQYSVIGVFPDLKKKAAKTVAEYSAVTKRGETISPLPIQLPIPRGAKSFLVCVRIDGCRKGKVDSPLTATGMRMVGAGAI